MFIFNGIGEAKILRNSHVMKTLNPFQYVYFHHLAADHPLIYWRLYASLKNKSLD